MIRRFTRFGGTVGFALVLWLVAAVSASAAPRIDKLSLRGLQAGGVTTLVIEGGELLPEPRLLLPGLPIRFAIKEGATAERLEVECTLEGQAENGLYLLRVASAHGVSEPVALGVDNLAQLAFAPKLTTLNVALSGVLNGATVLATTFEGKKGQQVTVEVESLRLGSKLEPVVHVYDARRTQIAWSRGQAVIAGDARCLAVLPADGTYTVELHDALFRGADPGFFRLKIGDFRYADLAYPLAVQQGVAGTFEFAATNLPADTKSTGTLAPADGLARAIRPAPWPTGVAMLSGSRPVVTVSDHAEVVEAPPGDKPQEVSAAPVAINGRISAAKQQDRYRLAVTPGQQLRFEVLARRAGSPLDGVLSIQNEQGAELAAGDDQPGTTDPGVDFKVPDGTTAVLVAIRDLAARGGADYVYRIVVKPPSGPDFSLAVEAGRLVVPKDGVILARVRATRMGYDGPIKLSFPNLPPSVSITGDEIPAGANQSLVTLSAPGLNPAQSLSRLIGTGMAGDVAIRRLAFLPETTLNKLQPWLREELALAVATPAPLALVWDLFPADARLAVGATLPIKVRVERAAGVQGAVRLSLLTTQTMPRKKEKVNNVEREVDDVERSLRLDAVPTVAADQSEATANVLVPGDLPQISYDMAIQAELLSVDNKSVVATVTTPARRLAVGLPIAVELANANPVEARAGLGDTGKVTGTIKRSAGFAHAVNVTLAGLPKGLAAPTITVAGDQTAFELPVTFPFGTPPGDLPNIKVSAVSLTNPKNPKSIIRAAEVPLTLKVVPGEKPPVEKPLTVFEDDAAFLALLTEGAGQATLAEEKYSGTASIKVTPDQRFNPALPGLGVNIREKPGPGEFRYLQFAWKKQGGKAICLQLNHDGQWGPAADRPAKFRYHSGPGGECFGGSLAVDTKLPADFTVVTRDLFADFGEFTLNGLAFSPVDGDFALYDHIYLGRAPEEFETVKPQ